MLRRSATAVLLLLGVATLTWLLLELSPGDVTDLWFGQGPVPREVRERIETAYCLNGTPLQRYMHWLGAVARGELGWSVSRSRDVSRALTEALPTTLLLGGAALLLTALLGVLAGAAAAARRGRSTDRLLTGVGLTAYALPTFWLGLMAILLLSYRVPLFPASSMSSVEALDWPWPRRLVDLAWHLVLPASVLAIASAAAMSRFVRAGMLEALGKEFVRAARARGAGPRRVFLVHALRHALLPVINLMGLSLPVLVSGSLVVEAVFAWPGMGRLAYDAVRAKDHPLVLAATLLSATLVILGNLAADLAMSALDPRVRLAGRRGDGR